MALERIEKLRNRMRDTTPGICIERARLVTEFYRRPSMDSVLIRRAKLLKYLLGKMTIYIDDEAILAGNHAGRYRSAPVFPEVSAWLRDELDYFETRSAGISRTNAGTSWTNAGESWTHRAAAWTFGYRTDHRRL